MNNPAPEIGDQCPACGGNGQVERAEFGEGASMEIHAWCGGLSGEKDDGCGWQQVYSANKALHP